MNYRSVPIKLSEALPLNKDVVTNTIQILRVGKFFHKGQKVEVTSETLKSMIVNFKENVRGIDLMIDFSHESDKDAAAWIKELYLSNNDTELWANVEWTFDGEDALLKKKYKYISADFTFNHEDNETLKEYGPTLYGAGLTNRPVVKRMNPIILSENNSEEKMEEELKKEIEMLKAEIEKLKAMIVSKDEESAVMKEKMEVVEKELAEKNEKIKLAEENAKKEKEISEKTEKFNKLMSEGKAVEAQRVSFMENNMEEFIKNAALINLSEKGTSKEADKEDKDVQDQVIELAEKVSKERSISIIEAQKLVLSENKELADKYNKEINN